MKRVGITGYSGFIGKRLVSYPNLTFQPVLLPLRGMDPGQLSLSGLDAVIHLAGKAHDMSNPEDSEYFDVNTELTRKLAIAAKAQGVRHFIYFSSVKVYDDLTGEYFNESSACHPVGPYGKSKYEAEQQLQTMEEPAFRVAIIRPPLVYGPGVKANMLNLITLSDKYIPLPFANSGNRRSMVFIDNLVELVARIVDRQSAGIFIPGDPEPLSTGQLVSLIRNQLGRRPGLFSLPSFVKSSIRIAKPMLYKRLYGSFVIDNTNTNLALEFKAPFQTEEGIREMVKWYIKEIRKKR